MKLAKPFLVQTLRNSRILGFRQPKPLLFKTLPKHESLFLHPIVTGLVTT